VLSLLLLAPAAHAGIADTPLPVFPPSTKPAKLVFSVPDTLRASALANLFSCTSLDNSGTIKVGVELFDGGGNLQNNVVAGDGSADVLPGQTVTFANGATAGVGADQVIVSVAFGHGSARIVSTSTKILCTAREVSTAGNPPTLFETITIIKAKVQKGD
jgi:hypothetical protein